MAETTLPGGSSVGGRLDALAPSCDLQVEGGAVPDVHEEAAVIVVPTFFRTVRGLWVLIVLLPNWVVGASTTPDQNVTAANASADWWMCTRKMSRSEATPMRWSQARKTRTSAGSEFMNFTACPDLHGLFLAPSAQ